MTRQWPAPVLQPTSETGCIEASVAYIAHCLGFPDVTPQMIADAKGAESPACERYIPTCLGYPVEMWWEHTQNEPEKRLFWLGAHARPWVETHLARGAIALVTVERVPGRAHAIVLLEAHGDAGVYVMDPLYGHRVDAWEWFLGVGASFHGAHHLSGWYTLPPL